MNPRKKEEDKKVKFGICVDPIIYKKMDDEMINKSRLIETLLNEHYGKQKSYKGMLVEIIVKSFLQEHLYDSVDELNEKLQERLNLNLNFETNVFDVETKNGHTFGKIHFNDENDTVKIIDFTITSNGVMV
jgi:hypothetical protein